MGDAATRREALVPPSAYALVATDQIAANVTVGETAFEASVSDDGNAQVTVPIWAPPGRGGLQPELAFVYRSSAGQGVVGQGWGLGGLSQIEKCRKNPAQDGTFGGPAPDELCLDGQRLVLTPDGYRAEVNGFDLVVNVPGGFEARRRDGTIATYGVTPDASVGGRAWAMSRLRDRSGNAVDWVYERPSSGGLLQHRLKQVSWGSAAAPRRLVFQYEDRPDKRSGNFAGVAFDLHSRLKQVDVLGPDVLAHGNFAAAATAPTLLKSYRVQYLPFSSAVTASRLASITECDGKAVCKAPLAFTYSPETLQFQEIPLTGITDLPVTSQVPTAFGQNGFDFPDIDGDGLDDLVYRNAPTAQGGSSWRYRLNTGGGFGPEQTPPFAPSTQASKDQGVQFVNLNRGPLVEALAPSFSASASQLSTNYLAYGFDTPFAPNAYFLHVTDTPTPFVLPGPTLLASSVVGDVNGDRLPDLLTKAECATFPSVTPTWCGLRLVANASGMSGVSFGPPSFLTFSDPSSPLVPTPRVVATPDSPIYVQDLDGNGINEVLVREGKSIGPGLGFLFNGTRLFAVQPSETGVSTQAETGLSSVRPGHRLFGDFNGDGYVDSLSIELEFAPPSGPPFADRLLIALNQSDLFAGGEKTVSHALPNTTLYDLVRQNEVRVADFTGDGLDDLLLASSMTLMVSNGLGGFSARPAPIAPGLNSWDGTAVTSNRRFEQLLDFDGDGQLDVSLMRSPNLFTAGTPTLYKRTGPPPGLLQTVTGGIATAKVTFVHEAIRPGASFYSAGASATYPQTLLKKGMWVVTSMSEESSDPAKPNRSSYTYADGRFDVAGRGWLGFGARTATDEATGETVTTTYDNVTARPSTANPAAYFYPNAFAPKTEVRRIDTRVPGVTAGAVLETRTEFERVSGFATLATSLPSVVRTTRFEAPANGSTVGTFTALTSTRTTLVHDDYGNVVSATTESFDAAFSGTTIPASAAVRKRVEATTFEPPDVVAWLVARAQRVQVTSTEPARLGVAERSVTRTTDFTYEPGTLLVKTVEVEPCAAQPCTETALTSGFNRKLTFARDAHGNPLSLTDAASGQSRLTQFGWDTLDATFPATTTNDKGHVHTFYFHAGFGELALADSEIGVRTSRTFDGFGRLKGVDGPTAADVAVIYGVAGGLTKVSAAVGGGGTSTELFDRWGRIHTRSWTGFGGAPVSQTFVHDALGRPTHTSSPAYAGQPLRYAKTTHDNAGRVVRFTTPSGATTRWTYEGLKLTVRDADDRIREVVRDGTGRLLSSTERELATGRAVTTRHGYAPFDLLEQVTDPGGNDTRIEYDRLGRRFALTDVNASAQAMLYTGYGELKRAVDGAATVMTYTHDSLGRLTSQTSTAGTDSFTWDAPPYGLGQLASTTSADGITTASVYDELGREQQARWVVGGSQLILERSFDAFGRVAELRYPSTALSASQFRVSLGYTGEGALESLRDTSLLNGVVTPPKLQSTLWRQVAVSASGQSEVEEFGNGARTTRRFDADERLQYLETKSGGAAAQKLVYAHSPAGLVQGRIDAVSGVTEDFAHDFLGRLTTWRVTQNCQQSELEYQYDDLGNLTQTVRVSGFGEDASYAYGGTNAGPQAVTSVTGPGGTSAFGYSTGGLQSSAPGRTLTFTPAQLPKHATGGGHDVTYSYDAAQGRVRKVAASGDVTTYAGGGLYQRRDSASGARRHLFDVEGMVQVEWPELTGGAIGTPAIRFHHADALGTPETVTGASGAVVEKMKHEPFGQRRHAAAVAFPAAVPTPRGVGFTGHEPDDEFGLIHMRGRIYDPASRRFLTPDPLVHSVAASQALNRYAYVANSPLNLVDPSGFDPIGIFGRHSPGAAGGPTSYSGATTLYSNGSRADYQRIWDSGSNWRGVARSALEAPNRSDSVGAGSVTRAPRDGRDLEWFTVADKWELRRAFHSAGIPAETVNNEPLPSIEEVWRLDVENTWAQFVGASTAVSLPVSPLTTSIGSVGPTLSALEVLGVRASVQASRQLSRSSSQASVLGQWLPVVESMSERAASYQTQITGRTGEAYVVNGVKFDGFANGVLMDAKGLGYARFTSSGVFRPWFKGASALRDQARRQLSVAKGTPIQWHFAEESAAAATRALMRESRIKGIEVLFTPFIP